MLETGTKATSSSHHTSTLPETQLGKIWTGPVPKLANKKQTLSKALVQHSTVLYSIVT